jgi:formylglycine-generating enzyme required for sulfatase activity
MIRSRLPFVVAAAVCLTAFSAPHDVAAQATAKQAAEIDAAVEQWAKALKQAQFPFEFQQVAEEALLKMDAAARLERFAAASSLGLTAAAAAGKAQLPWLKAEAAARKKEIDELRTAWEAARKMRTRADLEGNLVLGKYLCFVRGDWEHGFAKLMMSADDGLKELAWKTTMVKDDAAALVALGDVWWEKSQATAGKPQAEFQSGAAYLYAQALPNLEKPEADRIATRLKEATRSSPQGRVLPSIFEAPLTPEVTIRMRRLPPGRGPVGSPPAEPGRQPAELQHPVTITQPLYMAVTELTQQQWSSIMRQGNPSRTFGPDRPVHNVSWNQAQRFLTNLNALPIGRRYRFRLPTSDEWEYACRAGMATAYFYGPDPAQLPIFAWFKTNAGGVPHPVAKLRPNAWGFYDMLGNVGEWTATSYDPKLHPFPPGTNINPDSVVGRGGSFDSTAPQCRSASLGFHQTTTTADVFGLRVVCEPAAIDFSAK